MSVPAFLAAVHGRSPDGARAALAPGFQGKANGKPLDIDAQVRLLESFWTGFPDGNFTMEPTGGSGRHVITWTFSGTHDGVYLGVPPTGKPIAFSGFIISVSDQTGITSLDWKWDTKVFTKAVLGPDDVGDIVVKDNFRDPSARWSHGAGRGDPRRKKGKGPKPGGRPGGGRPPAPPIQMGPDGQPLPQQPGAPGGAPGGPGQPRPPRLGPDGQPLPPRPPRLGPDGQPLPRRRRRGRGKGGQPGAPGEGQPAQANAGEAGAPAEAVPDHPPIAPMSPNAGRETASAASAPSADSSGQAAPQPSPESKPEGA